MVVKVKLRLFAHARDLAGRSADILIVPEAISCYNLLQIIVERYSLQEIEKNILLSVNEQLYRIEDNLVLKEDDEVAVIPPLSALNNPYPPKRKKYNISITQEVQTNYVPPHLIQIRAPKADIDARIEKFMERKRAEINAHNNTEFFVRERDPEFSCSRVDAVVLKRKDSKSHLQVERVLNSYQYRDQKSSEYMKKYIPPNGIEERLQTLESQLSMGKPIPKNVYQRLKHLEDRLLLLESISPEYIQFWDKSALPTKSLKKKVFRTSEIDELIAEVQKKCVKVS